MFVYLDEFYWIVRMVWVVCGRTTNVFEHSIDEINKDFRLRAWNRKRRFELLRIYFVGEPRLQDLKGVEWVIRNRGTRSGSLVRPYVISPLIRATSKSICLLKHHFSMLVELLYQEILGGSLRAVSQRSWCFRRRTDKEWLSLNMRLELSVLSSRIMRRYIVFSFALKI